MTNATMLIALKVMLSKMIAIVHMIAQLGVRVATLSVLTAVVFQLIAPQTQMQANMNVHITIDLMLLVVHRILGVNMSSPTLTVSVEVGRVKSTIMLMM